jgi:hypothetical protein
VLGLAVLAAERLGGRPGRLVDACVGVTSMVVSDLRPLAARFGGPARRAGRAVYAFPPVASARDRVNGYLDGARRHGRSVVDAGRVDATALVHDGMEWTQQRGVPDLVDALIPYLVDSVLPRIVEGILPHLEKTIVPELMDATLPHMRETILPVLLEDLMNDPRLRAMVVEEGRDVVSEATDHFRDATAEADDRIEGAFRRLVHRRGEGPDEGSHR